MQETEYISSPDAEGAGMSGGQGRWAGKDLLLLAIWTLRGIGLHSESQEGKGSEGLAEEIKGGWCPRGAGG